MHCDLRLCDKNSRMLQGDFNVITVVWNSKDNYSQSASDTRTVGAAVALMARHLVNGRNITRRNLWCIGHSLGAHICGIAGKKFRFDRITGEMTGKSLNKTTL